jgi:hypothetical protein
MEEAMAYCLERNILRAFLKEHSSEVINMLLTEWNIDDAREIWQEEAREEGLEEGLQKVSAGAGGVLVGVFRAVRGRFSAPSLPCRTSRRILS